MAVPILLVLLFSLLVSTPAALAQTPTALTGFSVADINIRSGPGLNAGSVGILPAGEKVTAIGRNQSNNWIQIQYGTTTGWVAKWVTVYSGDTALLPVASSETPVVAAGPGPFALTSPFNVNIRSNPSVKATLLTTMPFTDHAQAIGRTDGSSWVNVDYKGTQGWVAAWLVLLSNDINALPVTSGESSSTPAAPENPTPTSPPETPVEPGTPPPPPPEGGITVRTPSRANIRSAPSATATVLDLLSFQDTATAVGQNASHNWLQIIRGDTEGWVARWVVITSDQTSGLEVTSDSSEVLPVPGGNGISGKSIYDVVIHSGPGVNYGTLATLPAYTAAPVTARTADNNWLKMTFQDSQGWVAAWLIVATGDYTNLPIEPSAQ